MITPCIVNWQKSKILEINRYSPTNCYWKIQIKTNEVTEKNNLAIVID